MMIVQRSTDTGPAHRGWSLSTSWQLNASLWAGVTVIIWETAVPLRSFLGPDMVTFAEWVALGLAGMATITAIQVKRRLHRKWQREEQQKDPEKPNPMGLMDVLREHGVREFGSMYLYMPMPKEARHQHAWAWLDLLDTKGLVKGSPWHIKTDHVKDTVRKTHPRLFEGDPRHFDVFRLDWQSLTETLGEDFD